MSAVVVIVALLALAGFLFWLANRYDSMPTGFFAVGALFGAVYYANGVLQ